MSYLSSHFFRIEKAPKVSQNSPGLGGSCREAAGGPPAGWPTGSPAAGPPAASRQPLHGLAEARWVLVDFRGLFGLVWGPIFNPKDLGTQVRYTMKKTKEISDKTGLRFDQSEFSKFDG